MTLCLSNVDLSRLQAASTTLLSPLAFESVEAWGAQAMDDVMALLGADKAYFALPTTDGMHLALSGDRTDDGMTAYLAYYWQVDGVLARRRVEMGLEVYHRDMLYKPGELARDELHNDWCIPHALYDTLGMGFDDEPRKALPSLLHVYHHRSSTRPFGDRGLALMTMLLPAFKAGVAAFRGLHAQRRALGSMLDDLAAAISVFDVHGTLLHRTPALTTLLNEDDDDYQIEQALAGVAQQLLAGCAHTVRKSSGSEPACPMRSLATRSARYVIRGCIAPAALAGTPMVLVTVERIAQPRADIDRIAREHGLTARERAMSVLLAQGHSIPAVATTLGVSRHTARHHVEHIMSKLGVHSRAAMMAKLSGSARGGAPGSEDERP